MKKKKTWKILDWSLKQENQPAEFLYEIGCVCGDIAYVPTSGNPGSPVIAIISNNRFVFDDPTNIPPESWLPNKIQCRKCKRIYSNKEKENTPCTENFTKEPLTDRWSEPASMSLQPGATS